VFDVNGTMDIDQMLVQTNSYIVPLEKREEHARLMRRFRQALARLGCDHFEVYEQVGHNWNALKTGGRYVQIMHFRDRVHYQAVQEAERTDPLAQALIKTFSELIDLPQQQEQHQFAVGHYTTVVSSISSNAAISPVMAENESAASDPMTNPQK
jgi:hypothetical protein